MVKCASAPVRHRSCENDSINSHTFAYILIEAQLLYLNPVVAFSFPYIQPAIRETQDIKITARLIFVFALKKIRVWNPFKVMLTLALQVAQSE
jgi:hypothetical protein